MRNFVLGFVSASLIFGGYLFFSRKGEPPISEPVPVLDGGAAPVAKAKRRRRGRRARTGGGGGAEGQAPDEPPERQLSAAELRPVTEGDTLAGTDVINMEEKGGGRELSQEEIDSTFSSRRAGVLECIDKARGDAPAHPGRVEVGLRVGRNGQVQKVRVSGPSYMMRAGLLGCVRRTVSSLRFPPPSSSLTMRFPFELH